MQTFLEAKTPVTHFVPGSKQDSGEKQDLHLHHAISTHSHPNSLPPPQWLAFKEAKIIETQECLRELFTTIENFKLIFTKKSIQDSANSFEKFKTNITSQLSHIKSNLGDGVYTHCLKDQLEIQFQLQIENAKLIKKEEKVNKHNDFILLKNEIEDYIKNYRNKKPEEVMPFLKNLISCSFKLEAWFNDLFNSNLNLDYSKLTLTPEVHRILIKRTVLDTQKIEELVKDWNATIGRLNEMQSYAKKYWPTELTKAVESADTLLTIELHDTITSVLSILKEKALETQSYASAIRDDRKVKIDTNNPEHINWSDAKQSHAQILAKGIKQNFLNFDAFSALQYALILFAYEKIETLKSKSSSSEEAKKADVSKSSAPEEKTLEETKNEQVIKILKSSSVPLAELNLSVQQKWLGKAMLERRKKLCSDFDQSIEGCKNAWEYQKGLITRFIGNWLNPDVEGLIIELNCYGYAAEKKALNYKSSDIASIESWKSDQKRVSIFSTTYFPKEVVSKETILKLIEEHKEKNTK